MSVLLALALLLGPIANAQVAQKNGSSADRIVLDEGLLPAMKSCAEEASANFKISKPERAFELTYPLKFCGPCLAPQRSRKECPQLEQ